MLPIEDQQSWMMVLGLNLGRAVCFLWLLITKVQNIDGKGKTEVFANTIKHKFRSGFPTR